MADDMHYPTYSKSCSASDGQAGYMRVLKVLRRDVAKRAYAESKAGPAWPEGSKPIVTTYNGTGGIVTVTAMCSADHCLEVPVW